MPWDKNKVVLASEMARIEKLSFNEGCSDAAFMDKAGSFITAETIRYIKKKRLPKTVILLVGKGNNGGDALNAGTKLLKQGYRVFAYAPFLKEKGSPLNEEEKRKFAAQGGKIEPFPFINDNNIPTKGVILDGLLGTGFKGQIEDSALEGMINWANGSNLPILAIDIPSGINGNDGSGADKSITATETLFLGLSKKGFFYESSWNKVGALIRGDFGLPEKYYQLAHEEAFLADNDLVKEFLPKPRRTRHKYQAGYVLALAGSKGMAGAAILSSFSALKSGAGIVRLFHASGMESELLNCPPEIIKESIDKDISRFCEEAKRAKSVLIGPGIGRSEKVKALLKEVLEVIDLPLVIDADALFYFDDLKTILRSKKVVLTPHHQEMHYLLKCKDKLSEKELWDRADKYARENGVTVVLKGSPTWIFTPFQKPFIIPRGTPAMAKAGTGDVLTGIIAGLLAQNQDPFKAACLGCYLHAVSGEYAAKRNSVYSVVASDLIACLPHAFKELSNDKIPYTNSQTL